jgi:hypothetical protein
MEEERQQHHVNLGKLHHLGRSASCGVKEGAIWTRRKSLDKKILSGLRERAPS